MQFTLTNRKLMYLGLLALLGACSSPQRSSPAYSSQQAPHGTQNTIIAVPANPSEQTLALHSDAQVQPVVLSVQEEFTRDLIGKDLWHLPQVEKQYRAYLRQSRMIVVLKPRWEQYFGYVLSQVRARGLPSELAMVPLVESLLDPFAYSADAAAGMWQFVDGTARESGLSIDWWHDSRRDPIRSTDAALDYLEKLYKRFDDWPLALAAYNGGAARVSRALKKNKEKHQLRNQGANANSPFWDLQLPRETTSYVPRIIGMARLLSDPDKFKLPWPEPNDIAFVEVHAEHQIDLARTAKKLQLSTDELYRYNPALNHWATPPAGPHRLLISPERADELKKVLEDAQGHASWQRYVIKNGDTLSVIAQRFHISTRTLKTANALNGSAIRAGKALLVPGSNSIARTSTALSNPYLNPGYGKNKKRVYRVVAGDSFWSIARKFNTSMRILIKNNRLDAKRALQIGQRILI